MTRKQLLQLGVPDRTISSRIKTGLLHRVYPGVYAVGHPSRAPVDRAAAAVLACGPGAVLSHFSAAALWGWLRWIGPFEVTVQTDRRPKDVRTHRSRTLEWRDCTRQLGIPVTTPARTLLDCAPALSDERLKRLASDALHSDYLSPGELADLLARCEQRAGARRLERYALGLERPTRSEFEDLFVAFTERFDLPRPEVNVRVGGREVDAFFRAEGVIVELDGYRFHASPEDFERDRDHDAEAVLNGLVTVRITWDRLTRKASTEAERLHAILDKRRLERNQR